jgi:hypothetical protein
MRTCRRTWLLLVATILILPSSLLAQCGVERWSVKTGTDADVSQVNLNSSTNTTITTLRAATAPNPIPANNRVAPIETTVWVINATLTVFKLESDSDYHMVIQDASGNTMITEIPAPTCVGAGSPFLPGITNARAEFDARFSATTSFQTANIPVKITGVGMFDFLHGQTGVAPNGIELHPVLDIVFNPGTAPDFSVAAAPTSLSVTQGSSGSATISTSTSGGFNSAVALSASGLPAGVTASFSPGSIAAPGSGSSTLRFTAGSTATTGTSTVTVTATGGGVTHTTTVTLTVSAAASPNFTMTASPASLSVTQGTSGSSSVSTTVSGGFNSAVALSASGLPAGVTASFNPSSIAAPGSGTSTLTFTASATAATGTATVTITGTGGTVTHTTTIALTIAAAGGGTTTTQVLGNPGFENGSTAPAPWVTSSGVINNSTSEPPHGGTWDAWLDGFGTTHTDTLMQQVSIASNATAATLTFWLHIDTAETSTTTAFDTLALQVRNSSGTVLSTLKTFSNLNKNTGYAQQTFDLTSFKGQTIQINFVGTEDASLQTSFVLDDLALNVTTPSTTDTTPPTTSVTAPANGATVSGTVTVNATASDNIGVTQMQLLIDGAVVASNTNLTSLSFSWNSTAVANGSHTIVSKAFDAAGNVGTSATVTVTVSNGTGTVTELIGNPGFENGAMTPAPWVLTSTHTPLSIINSSASEPPHAGTFDAWMNGWGTTTTDTVMQQVAIPANATAASFSFWLHIDTAETTTTSAFDTLQVQVRNSSGTVLQTLATFSNLNHATGYQQHTFSLASFFGQTIQVVFVGQEDASLQTSFVLDDISLKVTQ